jgi:hypothetical protein
MTSFRDSRETWIRLIRMTTGARLLTSRTGTRSFSDQNEFNRWKTIYGIQASIKRCRAIMVGHVRDTSLDDALRVMRNIEELPIIVERHKYS